MDKKTKKEDIEKWTLFVLSFDETYKDETDDDDLGIMPWAFLVRRKDIKKFRSYAKKAKKYFLKERINNNFFHQTYITDYLIDLLADNGIEFEIVGELPVFFKERKTDYLEKTIEMDIV